MVEPIQQLVSFHFNQADTAVGFHVLVGMIARGWEMEIK